MMPRVGGTAGGSGLEQTRETRMNVEQASSKSFLSLKCRQEGALGHLRFSDALGASSGHCRPPNLYIVGKVSTSTFQRYMGLGVANDLVSLSSHGPLKTPQNVPLRSFGSKEIVTPYMVQ